MGCWIVLGETTASRRHLLGKLLKRTESETLKMSENFRSGRT